MQDNEPNLSEFPFLNNDSYNYFSRTDLSKEDLQLGSQLSAATRSVIQNLISSLATSILLVQTDLEMPLKAEISRAYLKGMIDAQKYLLDLESLISEENNS